MATTAKSANRKRIMARMLSIEALYLRNILEDKNISKVFLLNYNLWHCYVGNECAAVGSFVGLIVGAAVIPLHVIVNLALYIEVQIKYIRVTFTNSINN